MKILVVVLEISACIILVAGFFFSKFSKKNAKKVDWLSRIIGVGLLLICICINMLQLS